MRRRSHSNYLPQDLLIKILHFLPFASLLKFKLVSKEWKAVINDPKFVNRYHDKSLTLFVSKGSLFCVLVRHNDDNKPATDPPCTVRRIPIGLEGEENKNSLSLVSEPSDAVACVGLSNYRFLLYNLFTGALYTAADLPERRLGFYFAWSCYEFGYDRCADDHKIVVAVKKDDKGFPREDDDVVLWIYSFRNRAWSTRRLEGFPYDACNRMWMYRVRACSSNGVLHWVVFPRENEEKPPVYTYDLRTHRFGQMSAPPKIHRRSWIHKLFQVGGQLCYGYIDQRYVNHVWVMKEYGVKESWAKLFTIPQSILFTMDKWRLRDDDPHGYFLTDMALCEPRDGEEIAVFWSDYNRHLIWYNVKDGSAEVVDYASLET